MSDAPPPGWGRPADPPHGQGHPPGPPQGFGPPGQPPPGQPGFGPPGQPGYGPPGQPGYGTPGPPGYGTPGPPGYGPPGYDPSGYGSPPQKSKTGLILGIVLGVIALLVVGGVGVALLASDDDPQPDPVVTAGTPTAGTSSPAAADPTPGTAPGDATAPPDAPGSPQPGGTTDQAVTDQSVFELAVGTCFDDPGSADEIQSVGAVPCESPHDNEVFALVEHPAAASDPYPGREALQEFAENECRGQRFTDYVGTEYQFSRFFVSQLTPTDGSWAQGDREIVCLLFDTTEQLTGSVQGSGE